MSVVKVYKGDSCDLMLRVTSKGEDFMLNGYTCTLTIKKGNTVLLTKDAEPEDIIDNTAAFRLTQEDLNHDAGEYKYVVVITKDDAVPPFRRTVSVGDFIIQNA